MTIDTSKLRVSTKSVAALVTLAGAMWQVPQMHAAVLSFLAAHPRWSGVAAVVATLWALLHDPEVRAECGLDAAQ